MVFMEDTMVFEWIVMAVFILYAGPYHLLWAGRNYNRQKAALIDGSQAKKKFYIASIVSAWIPALLVFVALSVCGISPLAYGFCLPTMPYGTISVVVAVLAGLYLLFICYQMVALRVVVSKGLKTPIKLDPQVGIILPVGRTSGSEGGKHEKLLFALLSLSAGITEELLFRSYFLFELERLIPGMGLIPAVLISSVLFGLMHAYLGKKQLLVTGLVGLIYGLIYIALGSVVPVIILHVHQDLASIDVKDARVGHPQGTAG